MGFEDGSKAIVIFSRNRVVFVVVALAALEGQSNESPRGVLNGFVQPSGPIEKKVVAGQEAGRSESVLVQGKKLVRCEHFQNYLIIALVFIE